MVYSKGLYSRLNLSQTILCAGSLLVFEKSFWWVYAHRYIYMCVHVYIHRCTHTYTVTKKDDSTKVKEFVNYFDDCFKCLK